MKNYQLFLEECARVLRPGGLIILAETEIKPMTENKQPIDGGPRGGAPGWHAFAISDAKFTPPLGRTTC